MVGPSLDSGRDATTEAIVAQGICGAATIAAAAMGLRLRR